MRLIVASLVKVKSSGGRDITSMCETMKRKLNRLKYLKTFVLSVFSFLLGCTLTISLTPIDKTCRIENTERGYDIMQNSPQDPELIVLILSAPKNLQKRNAIRDTWLKLPDTSPEIDSVKFKMKHYFVVGTFELSPDEVLHMSTEQSMYSDILLLPMHDSYKNLTYKVLQSFQWLNEQHDYGFSYKYVLKCDDDSFVRLDTLLVELRNLELKYLKSNINQLQSIIQDVTTPFVRVNLQINQGVAVDNLGLYWGYFNGNAKIQTSGKWKEPDWIACDRYLPYALGGGYVLSKNLVAFIAKNSEYFRLFNSEDVSVGLWLAPVANVLRVHDIRFDTEWASRGCKNFHLVTHSIAAKEMKTMYDSILKTNTLCTTEVTKRSHYFYDWDQPPSQCCGVKPK